MKLILSVTEGPHRGKQFAFDGHDTFLVGRVDDAHLQLSYDDPYFSRRHFVLEVNPPRCRVLDLRSRNGIFLNGERVEAAEVADGDVIKAGHTHFRVKIEKPDPERQLTLDVHRTVSAPANVPTGTVARVPAIVVPGASPGQSVIEGYEIAGELGRGGMGVVFRGVRLSDLKKVAVKMILLSAGASE